MYSPWPLLCSSYKGMAACSGAGPVAKGTKGPAQLVATAYGPPAGRWQPPMVQPHWLKTWGLLPRWWLLPMKRLQRMATPNGGGLLIAGTGSHVQ